MKAIPQCAGVFYWEPEVDDVWKPAYYSNLGWGAFGMGVFTTDGRPTAALDAFGDGTSGLSSPSISRYQFVHYYDLQGRRIDNPTKGFIIVEHDNDTKISFVGQ